MDKWTAELSPLIREVGSEYVNGAMAQLPMLILENDVPSAIAGVLGGTWTVGLEVGIELALRYPAAARALFAQTPAMRPPEHELELEDSVLRLAGHKLGRA